MNTATFGVIMMLNNKNFECEYIDDYKGLAKKTSCTFFSINAFITFNGWYTTFSWFLF